MESILVTGGAGYIGSHIVETFAQYGYHVISVDILNECVESENISYYKTDIRNIEELRNIFTINPNIRCVIHCAGELGIERSYNNKELFFNQNVFGTDCVINTMIEFGVDKIIFASSAAVYSDSLLPQDEDSKLHNDMSPYSYSKCLCERKLEDISQFVGIDYVAFRYFNVVGCNASDKKRLITYLNGTNIVPAMLRAVKSDSLLYINGNDYDTKDGTCFRDYINVEDLARLHLTTYEKMISNEWDKSLNGVYNAGTGKSYSIKELIDECENVTDTKLRVKYSKRRKGDSPFLCANIDKTKSTFNWSPDKKIGTMLSEIWETYKLN